MQKTKSLFHILIVVLFGIFFISTLIQEPTTTDPLVWWWEVCWAILAVGMGSIFAIYNSKFIYKNHKGFLWLYEKTHFSIFKKQAEAMLEPHMYLFARAMGVLFVVIGTIMLFRNLFL